MLCWHGRSLTIDKSVVRTLCRLVGFALGIYEPLLQSAKYLGFGADAYQFIVRTTLEISIALAKVDVDVHFLLNGTHAAIVIPQIYDPEYDFPTIDQLAKQYGDSSIMTSLRRTAGRDWTLARYLVAPSRGVG
jgi:hypothetical protein